MRGRVVVRVDDAERDVAHVVQLVVVSDVAGRDQLDAGLVEPALAATKGQGGGDALLAAMKGQVFESPRGPVLIDAQTRDIVQDVYIRKVERVNGGLYNVEFDKLSAVKDPGKAK